MTVIIGAIFTFGAVAYTTTRAAANSAFNHKYGFDADDHYTTTTMASLSNGTPANPSYHDDAGTITEAPRSLRRDMRYEALRQAVNQGSLPESALTDPAYYDPDDDDDDDDNESPANGEEREYTKYSYVLFHIIFFLATQYIAALLTINVGVTDANNGTFVPVGRTYFNSWLKIVSSWTDEDALSFRQGEEAHAERRGYRQGGPGDAAGGRPGRGALYVHACREGPRREPQGPQQEDQRAGAQAGDR
ncbi:hypothetical protein PMKS-002291 [Pichia membranifaciens]|uniref:Uncharacterized protein n=1 Tax=Pichia membranifaciens TaxID=4926 RepID=A0A1Q2YH49_9ASCO|nr:hypothetical protein PMKS-002291 [Pichia membranifaciens]